MSLIESNRKISKEELMINITGEHIILGPLRRDLLHIYQQWENDYFTSRTREIIPRPCTVEAMQAKYEGMIQAENQGRAVYFTIYDYDTLQPIGNTVLDNIDYHNRTATFGITIGETAQRGKGYGTEAARLILDYAFTALDLHNVMLEVWSFNLAGIHAYQKAGFREYGRRHQCKSLNGKLWDSIYMECLSTDFTSPVLSKVFVPDEQK